MKLHAHITPHAPGVQKAVMEMKKYARDRVELAKVLYMFVRDHIRYPFEIALRMPVFGQFPEETMWYGWGICQDSANLLASLLIAGGFRVAYVYPFRGGRLLSMPLPTDFSTLHSYVAVYLPEYSNRTLRIGSRNYKGWVPLDPTGRMGTIGFTPFGKVPASDLPGKIYNDMLIIPIF
ncbi:MAG: transglutaminase family protein, partial [Candidatus Methanomethylicaceae archaeon]